LKLFTYWRSTAAYRVRIGLAWKGIAVEHVPVHLVRDGGEQHGAAYRGVNPNRTVPALVLADGRVITQSLAILDYLEETIPEPPLLPAEPADRAMVRAASQLIACDVHPVNNLRVGAYLKRELVHDQDDVVAWMRHWMNEGLTSFQALIAETGPYCFGGDVTMADLCLVPQLYNARRWGLDVGSLGRLVEIETNCLALPAFDTARPEAQPDAEPG